MTYNEQTDSLTYEILGVVTRYLHEFDLNEATIVGVLENVKTDLLETWATFDADFDVNEMPNNRDEEEDDDDDDQNGRGGFYRK